MNEIYRSVGTSKQNVHQRLHRTLKQSEEREQLRRLVGEIREDHPSMGARSLYQKIRPKTMGRDRFYGWYRAQGFTVTPSKNWCRTTDSSGVIRFKNLIEGIELNDINQVWVSDITYYELNDTFYYLTFVMDQYSRKIKGFCASRDLHTEQTTIPALKQAHHSFRWWWTVLQQILSQPNTRQIGQQHGKVSVRKSICRTPEQNYKEQLSETLPTPRF